ncbi:MAG: hypothetical protein DRP42_02655, partial [Tenericutes bacterium]
NAVYERVAQLPAPYNANAGLPTDSIASPAAGNTFVHEADFTLEFDLDTLPSASGIFISLRYQDASNYWWIWIDLAGNFRLYEEVGGSTLRADTGGLSGGEHIRLTANGSKISAWYDDTLAWEYESATNFATETNGEVDSLGTGGVISNLKTFPMLLEDEVRGNVVANTEFTHPADGRISFVLDTLPSADNTLVYFRVQDAANLWYININSAGRIYLYEYVDGAATSRDSVVALSGGEFIEIEFTGSTITGYYNGVQLWQWTDATNFVTETTGEVKSLGTGGAISHLKTEQLNPLTIQGIATDWLMGRRQAGEAFEHEADCIIEFMVDELSGAGQIEVLFRIQDLSPGDVDCWEVFINASGDIRIYELVSSSTVLRATALGALSGGERIVII